MKVFVSSTRKDLKHYRLAVRDAILNMGYHPIMMEYMGAGKMTPKKESLEMVEESDIFIGIYAHRYGYIPYKEKTSITEQEYKKAVDEKKEIYCFIVASNKEWPEEDKEDTKKLQTFLKKITTERVVAPFTTPDNLAASVTTALSKVKRRQAWQDIAKGIPANKKLGLIDDLINENSREKLSDEALKITSKLITSNFESHSRSIPDKLIDYTGELLDGTWRFGMKQFSDRANKLTKKLSSEKSWNKRAIEYIKHNYLAIFIGLLIGFMLALFFYIGNILNDETIDWLINEKAEKSIVLDDLTDPGTVSALIALSFAYERDPDDKEITNCLDKLLIRSNRLTKSRNLIVQQLNNNIEVLEALHNRVPYEPLLLEINSLKTRAEKMVNKRNADKLVAELNNNSTDASVRDTTLIKGYQNLLNNYSVYIDTNTVKNKLLDVTNSYNQYKKQLAVQSSDTLTVMEKLSSYQKFVRSYRNSPEKKQISEEIRRLENIIDNYASINSEENFVTCRGVNNKMPYGIRNDFTKGSVWVWAKINSPTSERIEFKWYLDKKFVDSSFSTIRKSNGFRVYYSRNYREAGPGEVRLYNSRNLLIGRKVFHVK